MAKKKASSSKKNKGTKDSGSSQTEEGYQVLARKYRPANFDDLIGQDAMVRTLSNAFQSGRIAQAYMLTGVRGVGKTTTARILARALNYAVEGEDGGPTIDISQTGIHCDAIMNSRHMDVLEMDAASNTGVDNIRELIESARYKPVNARYKVYIIDEVHMLSKGAFNALLKTLEEPPPHVKFIFATTEVRKVPVTVLSRCQRFDLKRVDIEELSAHFKTITEKEGASIDEEALMAIARAAEGSVRDGLSILDQAIALGDGKVTGADVRQMIGLADRVKVFDLFELIMQGEIAAALALLQELHKDGAEAGQMMADLADAVHIVTRIKAAGADAGGQGLAEGEVTRAETLSAKLSMPVLARAWQMLLKGLTEVRAAPRPIAAAEMLLIRMAYSAELPSPDELIRQAGQGGALASSAGSRDGNGGGGGSVVGQQRQEYAPQGGDRSAVQARPRFQAQPQAAQPHQDLQCFEDVIALVAEKRDMRLKIALEEHARLVSFRPGVIELQYVDGVPKGLAGDLGKKLSDWTGVRWAVSFSNEKGQATVKQVKEQKFADDLAEVSDHPLMKEFLAVFPDAKVEDVRDIDRQPLLDDGEMLDDDTGLDDE